MFKESKWAAEILSMQRDDGSWGYFHTLSEPKKYPVTTEQALKRLSVLGYTIEDEPIKRAVQYMSRCLSGENQLRDRREMVLDWDIFEKLMLSAWISRFTPENALAEKIGELWAETITFAFEEGAYSQSRYNKAYYENFGAQVRGHRLVDFTSFYQVSLIADRLNGKTEGLVFNYILNSDKGIFYVYSEKLANLPQVFESKKASRYLGAIEEMTRYQNNTHKLQFVADWLKEQKNENNQWDMSSTVIDKVYFPLSDSWRIRENREKDCTYRIEKLISDIQKED